MSYMRGDLLAKTRKLVKGLARAEPIWFKAMEKAPPPTFPRAEKKLKPISLPEDVFVNKFFQKHPDSKHEDAIKSGILGLIFDRKSVLSHNLKSFQQLHRYYRTCGNSFSQNFSTIGANAEKLRWKGSSCSILTRKLERALQTHQLDEAWETYKDLKRMHGSPNQFLVANLIVELSYSSNSKCLHRAFDLVLSILKEKSISLRPETITKLVISLARAQNLVLAASILRLMLEKKSLPSLDVLQMVFLHLVKTQIGTYLASNILVEICDCFQKLNSKKSSHLELTKPDTTIFNLVLDACVRFGSPLKCLLIMELMPLVGVIADAHTVVIIANIHEMNGMRDELKKFKDYIDVVPVTLLCHYQQFYECLLNLNFNFNDIDAVSELLLEMSGHCNSNLVQKGQRTLQEACSVSIGSYSIKMGSRLQFFPLQVQKDSVYKVASKQELVSYKNGNFVLSTKGLAKLIILYRRNERINDLSKLLIRIQNMSSSSESRMFCSDVIGACIHLGWLETAHDILEDLESEKCSVCKDSYTSLLEAYSTKKMFREAEALERQIRRSSPDMTLSDEMASSYISKSNDKRTSCLKDVSSDLAKSIIKIMREEEKVVTSTVHEYNSSIYFFTKAKMIGDALITYRKMQEMNQPTVSTFFHLICGYSFLGMYREITIIWADIKRNMENQKVIYNRDLYELLLLNFIRGGYFERVMEVIGFMMQNNLYLDKCCYKIEFLKFHRDLYRNLTAANAKNDAQIKRIEYVEAFKKWVGIG